MRVTFVLPFAGLAGGMRVIAIYADHLKKRGHQVNLISMPLHLPLKSKVKSFLLGRGWPGRRKEPSHFDGIDVPHKILDRARSVANDDVPQGDVVIATYYTTASGVLALDQSKGAKAIFIQNYEVEEGKSNSRLDASWKMPMHKITISNWLVDLARNKFGDEIVSHVPNSVDTSLFHAPARNKQARPTVGLLYNTFSLKGLPTSRKALQIIQKHLPDVRIVSFGAEHQSFRQPLPRGAEFHLRPPQERIRELYAQCDVWMCGSNVEGFHLPPVEAMACRCPVVSTRVGGPMDIIEEGVNGHLVNVKDFEMLALRTLKVLNLSAPEWEQMSRAAYRTATSFTWSDATTRFEQALEFAIERSRRGDFLTESAAVASLGRKSP